jgi:hypothetical protein
VSRGRGRTCPPPPPGAPAEQLPLPEPTCPSSGSNSSPAAAAASASAAWAAAYPAAAAAAAAAAAKLAEEKAAAEAAAARKAQEAALVIFSELALWGGLEAEDLVGNVGTVKQIGPANQQLELPFRRRAVHHVVNPVLQAAYERKKEALAARLGAANINEQFLIHGTLLANSEGIISNNFCLSKVGRNTVDDTGVCVLSLNVSSHTLF